MELTKTQRWPAAIASSAAALVFLLAAGAPRVLANTMTFPLNIPDSAVSAYPGPYVTVTVDLTTSTTANITFTADSSGGFTYLMIDSSAADVNVHATSFTAAFDSATNIYQTNGFSAPTPASSTPFGSGTVDTFGSFNNTFDLFDGTDHAASSIEYTLTNTGGTWSSAGDVLADNSHDLAGAAHIAVFSGTPVNGQQLTTGYVAPEPAAITLVGVVLLAFIALAVYRRRKIAA